MGRPLNPPRWIPGGIIRTRFPGPQQTEIQIETRPGSATQFVRLQDDELLKILMLWARARRLVVTVKGDSGAKPGRVEVAPAVVHAARDEHVEELKREQVESGQPEKVSAATDAVESPAPVKAKKVRRQRKKPRRVSQKQGHGQPVAETDDGGSAAVTVEAVSAQSGQGDSAPAAVDFTAVEGD